AVDIDGLDTSTVVVQNLTTGDKKTVLRNAGGGARYVGTGHLVYAQGGTLLAVPFDVKALEVRGGSLQLVEGVRRGPAGGADAVRPADFDVSSSGTLIYFSGPRGPLSGTSRVFMLGRGASPSALAETSGATFSPDGRWVAYSSSDRSNGVPAPDRGLYVQPFPATGARYQAPKVWLDYHAVWAPDGKALYYVPAAARPTVRVDFQASPTPSFGAATTTTLPLPGLQSGRVRGYDVLPDESVITLAERDLESEAGSLNIVVNWVEELKRLVPVP
ncbi:MAG: hypothetical protein ABL982_24665, partial [Vicinamibacterales bacterium]